MQGEVLRAHRTLRERNSGTEDAEFQADILSDFFDILRANQTPTSVPQTETSTQDNVRNHETS